ncbi:MAG: AlkA N-terminal domain-containing protein [Vicinamibacterales bacterium]
MDLDRRVCDRARRSRDARFDGRFFIGVTTTRIYCRPICPARAPKDEHVRYFPTAAAAQAAGFRPCLRCRPEASPGTPAWSGTSGVVSRALRLISEGALDESGVAPLADRLGVTDRHLRRLFLQHLGATPLEVALTRRVHFAKKLLDETTLSCRQVAMAAGFGSLRRFNGQIRRTYSRTPTELRRLARRGGSVEPKGSTPPTGVTYRFRLAYRPPYDWPAALAFLAARATPGVECVDAAGYWRTISLGGKQGTIRVSRADTGDALNLEVRFPDPRALLLIVERVRRIFDLGADPAVIADQLGDDPLLRASFRKHPGIRTLGAWDGFELAVRAIIGQQISVRGATTIAGRIAAMFGTPSLFPTPAQLMAAPIEEAGVIAARATAIRELAGRVADGRVVFGETCDPAAAVGALRSIRGIGEWTAHYIAMRALGEPDAFPSGDVVLRRMSGGLTARELDRRAEAWRPWRSYAVMLLWQSATDENTHEHTTTPLDAVGRTSRRVALERAR